MNYCEPLKAIHNDLEDGNGLLIGSIDCDKNSFRQDCNLAERVAQCVNDCAGIEDPGAAIREAREALKAGIKALNVWINAAGDRAQKSDVIAVTDMESALAKLQPKTKH